MNDLQHKENDMISRKKQNNDEIHIKAIQQYSNELAEIQKKKIRNFEKIYAQVLQLASVAEHLKDLVGLAKLDEFKSNTDQIQNYIESNFQNSIYLLIKMLDENKFETSKDQKHKVNHNSKNVNDKDDSESTIEASVYNKNLKFDSEKIKTRANNFKKFRESTTNLIRQLFDYQFEQKCQIIRELQAQIKSSFETHKLDMQSKDQHISELENA